MGKKEKKMELWEHLEELRIAVFKIIATLTCTTVLSFYFVNELYDALMRPVALLQRTHPEFGIRIIYSGPFDPVFVVMKIAFLGGVILGFPLVMFFVWSFIAPAMKRDEYHAFLWVCGVGSFFFACGSVLGYFSVAPLLRILTGFAMGGAENLWRIGDFISFMLYWLLCTGIIFELPLVIIILTRIGIVDVALLKRIRPFVFVGSLIVAALITPPDPVTMAMIGGPLILLYEIGIFLASLTEKRGELS